MIDVERLARALPAWAVEHPVGQTEAELRLAIARNIADAYGSDPTTTRSDRDAALRKAARDMVWTLYARDQHDNEGHNLPAIEAYFVRRWLRSASPSDPEASLHEAIDAAIREWWNDGIRKTWRHELADPLTRGDWFRDLRERVTAHLANRVPWASPSDPEPDEARRLLGYLWNATGKNHLRPVHDLFDENDPIVADVERLAIFPDAEERPHDNPE